MCGIDSKLNKHYISPLQIQTETQVRQLSTTGILIPGNDLPRLTTNYQSYRLSPLLNITCNDEFNTSFSKTGGYDTGAAGTTTF
jgi:hypothetical protein